MTKRRRDMMNSIDAAIRIFKKLAKAIERGSESSEARRWRDYKRFFPEFAPDAGLTWLFLEAAKKSIWKRGENADGQLGEARARFGYVLIGRMVSSGFDGRFPSVTYSCTHDLDVLNYTRAALKKFAKELVEDVWMVCNDTERSLFDEFIFDRERFENSWESIEYYAKYSTF